MDQDAVTRWSDACGDIRWALYAIAAYLVACAVVGLLSGLGELEDTAAGGPELVERIPYWHEAGR